VVKAIEDLKRTRPERVPPHNLEAEESVLGSMMLSAEAIAAVVDVVKAEDFYRSAHQRIFEAVLAIYARGEPVDAITAVEELKRRHALEEVGGPLYVYNLVASGTVEAAVLHLLEAKLNLFELVIGEIDMILGNLDDEREFQEVIADVWAEAADTGDFARRMDELGNRLLAAKKAYFEQRSHDDKIFGDRFSPDS